MATPSFGSGAAVSGGQEPSEQSQSTSAEHAERRPQHAEIERRAYFIYLDEGGGDPEEHWYRAERELAHR